jgi:hypothetical protein
MLTCVPGFLCNFCTIDFILFKLQNQLHMAKAPRKNNSVKKKLADKISVQHTDGQLPHQLTEDVIPRGKAALLVQNNRTAKLNALASQLNTIMSTHADFLKHDSFYHKVQKKFRKASTDNRFLLLTTLKEMELHTKYPLHKTGRCDLEVARKGKNMIVTLKVDHHPLPGKHEANCYYYEVLLLYWNKTEQSPRVSKQYSDWVIWNRHDPSERNLPIFDFVFPITSSTTHWLIAVRRKLGKNNADLAKMVADGMQIMEVGTWDKKEAAMLKKATDEAKAHNEKAAVEPVRVKARPNPGK